VSVEMAQAIYRHRAITLNRTADDHESRDYLIGSMEECAMCHRLSLDLDAASIAYDLAVAEASLERIRGSVAW
jgi:hypothetical protein